MTPTNTISEGIRNKRKNLTKITFNLMLNKEEEAKLKRRIQEFDNKPKYFRYLLFKDINNGFQ
jgi:hypothetical protein